MEDPVISVKLKPLADFLVLPNLIELSAVRPEEIALEIVGQGYKFIKAPALTTDYWTKLCYVLGNKDGVVFDPVTQPRISTRLPEGHRFEAMIGKTVDSGLSVSIRLKRHVNLTFADFGVPIDWQHALTTAVQEGQAILISGGTSSGKTTFLNLLMTLIPDHQRVLTVEDTRELDLHHRNAVSYVVSRNEKSPALEWSHLIDHLMRSRPDLIIAGELSIANTFALISLLDTGHRGFMTTVHANSCHLALEETIPTKVHLSGRSLTGLSEYLKKTVDWVIQVQKVSKGQAVKRQVTEIWQPQKHFYWHWQQGSLTRG